MTNHPPLMIAVAPNGARKTKADHINLPITPDELADDAQQCLEAGACMIHLHVRDNKQRHTLAVNHYRNAISAIRARIGSEMIIQVTTEAAGLYKTEQQMQMVRELRPEAISLSIGELCPDKSYETLAGEFIQWLGKESISPQYIVYSVDDVVRFNQLCQCGIIAHEHISVLYVLGRGLYSGAQDSSALELLPLLAACQHDVIWSVCAFGASEASCLLTAAGLGGHCRVGFENNTKLISGKTAFNNQALVTQISQHAPMMGRDIASPFEARKLLKMTKE